jgi:hypothetical protein
MGGTTTPQQHYSTAAQQNNAPKFDIDESLPQLRQRHKGRAILVGKSPASGSRGKRLHFLIEQRVERLVWVDGASSPSFVSLALGLGAWACAPPSSQPSLADSALLLCKPHLVEAQLGLDGLELVCNVL